MAYKLGLSYATVIHNVFYIGILIPFLSDKAYRKYFAPVSLWVIAYVLYLLLLHFIHGNSFIGDLKYNYRVLFVFVFAVEVYENLNRNKIDLKYFVKVFKFVLFFEIVLCWFQFLFHGFGNLFRITEYTWNGEMRTMSGDTAELIDSNLCLGTLMGSSMFANFMAVSIVTLILAKHKAGLKRDDLLLLVLCVPTLLITGIRAPLLVMLLMLFLLLLRGKKTHIKVLYVFIGISATVLLLPALSRIGSQGGLNSVDNPVMRSMNVFTQFETGTISEEGTLTWPLSMIPYIVQHPLLGNGLHHRGGYLMGLNLHVIDDESPSDAGIFYYWAEYGLIGLLVFYFFYYYIIRICPRYGFNKSDIRILVIMLFLQSIVDLSVIDLYCTTIFALAPILIRYYQSSIVARNTRSDQLTAYNSLLGYE